MALIMASCPSASPPLASLVLASHCSLTMPSGLTNPRWWRWRRGLRKREAEGKDASGPKEKRDLEEEVYEFMETSKNPGFFSTNEQLITAGRKDLADAIAAKGGWLAYGWNLEEESRDGGYLDSSKRKNRKRRTAIQ